MGREFCNVVVRRLFFCVVAVFVNEIDIVLTPSLSMQVFLREMGRESGQGRGFLCANSPHPSMVSAFSLGISSLQPNPRLPA